MDERSEPIVTGGWRVWRCRHCRERLFPSALDERTFPLRAKAHDLGCRIAREEKQIARWQGTTYVAKHVAARDALHAELAGVEAELTALSSTTMPTIERAPDATPTTPGQILRARREAAGLTLGQLASSATVSLIDLSAFERDVREPSPAQKARLDFALRGTP